MFENNWVAGQPGNAILFTPRNQGGSAPWVVVQDVTFQYNIVRHTTGGVNILGIDNVNGLSQITNHLTIADNVFDDISSAWGTGGRVFQSGAGADSVTINHNTVVGDAPTLVSFYGNPTTHFTYTNNTTPHNKYGINGTSSSAGKAICDYAPNAIVRRNTLAGGNASLYAQCAPDNDFPTMAAWYAGFKDYAGGDYHLRPEVAPQPVSTDGRSVGADIDKVDSQTRIALSGDNRGGSPIVITPGSLPKGLVGEPYTQTLQCSRDSKPVQCVWRLLDTSRLPAGIVFDAGTATFRGTPTALESGSVTVEASNGDPNDPRNVATQPFTLEIGAPEIDVRMPAASTGQVGVAFKLTPTVTGAVGSTIWTLASGSLPDGIGLNSASGVIEGVPTNWGAWTASVQVKDSLNRPASAPATVTITIDPAPLEIVTKVLPNGKYKTMYTAMVNATGGKGAITWSLATGTLPTGVLINPSGTISGVAESAGTFAFEIQATDAAGTVKKAPLSLTIEPPPFAIAAPAVLAATVGQPLQFAATATGNVGIVTWSVELGSLPPGLTLGQASGAIAGTPTAAGKFSIVIQGKDSFDPTVRVASAGVTIDVVGRNIVLYAADAAVIKGTWTVVGDATAAGGRRIANPDAAAAKLTAALASPQNYFELTFHAEAGVAYHLWMRGKAEKNSWANDSVYVQFAGSVDASGAAINRIGSAAGAAVSIEEGTNAGLAEWGWGDNSYGGLGSAIYFNATGPQTIRVQVREDGLSLDQIVLSADTYASAAPGASKNDATILTR